ncbi:DUF2256 domain-containing protein [Undibacterium oligocarboniphilum]|uniref:DUF2256 domain-containing protein n=1 Tax=Undibacterium oligocarboniphilum TaxID=666702 RepID=A0A850QGQ1_9BURK|nr:DUF2256 domain-containing protein [Undibacterium oligocarboniphilum]MBC3868625.1 DUF2256 domain-containing protein [Undibacterium oligocarboniphilum]NVO76605.1 DUF2256 domain-containing protein [Undibacterium oligocarboniphilum]
MPCRAGARLRHFQEVNVRSEFKGNKSYLPFKPCQACGRPMSWRKKWAGNWTQVKFCSNRCRQQRERKQ